jgi:hypothetical protein
MRRSRLISIFVAIILLIALSQKIGFGIFYHNWQHSKNCSNTTSKTADAVSALNCSCIDDFTTPFTVSGEREITPVPRQLQDFILPPFVSNENNFHLFNSLRAPPTLLS